MSEFNLRKTIAFLVFGLGAAEAQTQTPYGTWKANDGEAAVRVAPCGDGVCGTIVALSEPNDPATGRPKTDVNNPDPSLRAKPIIGLTMMRVRADGPNVWRGTVYNGQDGRIYAATLAVAGETLQVRGCVLGGIICRTQVWTK
jgi:uncharacterized protein (DUF2147 family)